MVFTQRAMLGGKDVMSKRCEACFSKDGIHVEMEYHPNTSGPAAYNECPRCHTAYGLDGELLL